jgi:predicted transposase YdaD
MFEFDQISRYNNAIQKGERKGERKNALKVARNLLTKGSSLEFVQEITGLDMETIEGLRAGQ